MTQKEVSAAFLKALDRFGISSFSTADFIKEYENVAPDEWRDIVSEYGMGGKGSGKQYSAFSRVSQLLGHLSTNGLLERLDYRQSPPWWGSPIIRYWTKDRSSLGGTLFPEEANKNFDEGTKTQVLVNKFERNKQARLTCIEHFGLRCQGCLLDFESRYGAHGAGFIHVHHLLPISETAGPYEVDPIADLRPVCPNCHAMIHYKEPMLTIEDLRALLEENSN